MLLVHYNDLKADLPREMRRIADFLGIAVPPELWQRLVEAAGFEAMRRNGDALMGSVVGCFRGGGRRFFNKGTNGRWRDVLTVQDSLDYERTAIERLGAECAHWLATGEMAERAAKAA